MPFDYRLDAIDLANQVRFQDLFRRVTGDLSPLVEQEQARTGQAGQIQVMQVHDNRDALPIQPPQYFQDAQLVVNVEVPGVLHREFVTSRSVYQVVRRELFTTYGLPTPDEPRPRRLLRLA